MLAIGKKLTIRLIATKHLNVRFEVNCRNTKMKIEHSKMRFGRNFNLHLNLFGVLKRGAVAWWLHRWKWRGSSSSLIPIYLDIRTANFYQIMIHNIRTVGDTAKGNFNFLHFDVLKIAAINGLFLFLFVGWIQNNEKKYLSMKPRFQLETLGVGSNRSTNRAINSDLTIKVNR